MAKFVGSDGWPFCDGRRNESWRRSFFLRPTAMSTDVLVI